MRLLKNIFLLSLCCSIFLIKTLYLTAEENLQQNPYPFQGLINANNINIRSDSSVNSEIICKVNMGDEVKVISESYQWYKIKLPKNASLFIKKEFLKMIDDQPLATLDSRLNHYAKVLKDNVNIRLRPDTSSPILGQLNKNEMVEVLEDKVQWYRIKPNEKSIGWIHKNFVTKIEAKNIESDKKDTIDREIKKDETIVIEGLIKPKVITRIATHKLLGEDNKLYLLRSNKEELNSFNYHKIRITGNLINPTKQKNPIIEVEKIEVLN